MIENRMLIAVPLSDEQTFERAVLFIIHFHCCFFMEYMQMHRLLKNLKDIFGKNGFSLFLWLLAKLFSVRTIYDQWLAEHSHYIHITGRTKSFQRFFNARS